MSTHPNAILLLRLTPDDLARKTYRAILADAGLEEEDTIKIGDNDYNIGVMESDYDDGWQISAAEGDTIVFDMITYGYGETIKWDDVVARKSALEMWAQSVCAKHHCTASFYITANYW